MENLDLQPIGERESSNGELKRLFHNLDFIIPREDSTESLVDFIK